MAVKTSNKPSADTTLLEEREDMIAKHIEAIKETIDRANDAAMKTEELKIHSFWDTGERFQEMAEGLSRPELAKLRSRLQKETGMDKGYFSTAEAVRRAFTDDQIEQIRDKKLGFMLVKALVEVKDENTRAELLEKALDGQLDSTTVRTLTGKQGSRAEATKKNRLSKDRKKPPMRVFAKCVDQTSTLDDTIAATTEAINRLQDVKEKDKKDTFKVLKQSRTKLKKLGDAIDTFLKFSDGVV